MLMEIHIVNIKEIIEKARYTDFLGTISMDKVSKIEKLSNNDDKIRTIIGEALLRNILIKKKEYKNDQIEFIYNDYGKPKIKGNNSIEFNISHSVDFVVIAIDSKQIGIDIEKIKHIDFFNIAKRFFTHEEISYILNNQKNTQITSFYKIWTLKESYIKFIGKGLARPLNSFSILINENNKISLKDNCYINKEVYFFNIDLTNEYQLSICSCNKFTNIEIITHNYKSLANKYLA